MRIHMHVYIHKNLRAHTYVLCSFVHAHLCMCIFMCTPTYVSTYYLYDLACVLSAEQCANIVSTDNVFACSVYRHYSV